MGKIFTVLFAATALTGCFTTHSEGFVNYKVVGDVYGTKPQTVDYEEVGTMKSNTSGFFWASCDDLCKGAVVDLKEQSKDRGGDSLIDLTYGLGKMPTKTPTCATSWNWADLLILPLLSPWKKECVVEGVAVARAGAKAIHQQAQKNQADPGQPVQININNTQNNGTQAVESKPAH